LIQHGEKHSTLFLGIVENNFKHQGLQPLVCTEKATYFISQNKGSRLFIHVSFNQNKLKTSPLFGVLWLSQIKKNEMTWRVNKHKILPILIYQILSSLRSYSR